MSVAPAGPPAPALYPYAAPDLKGVRLRSPRGLAIALAVLFALVVGTDLFAVFADWNLRSLMERVMADSGSVSAAELNRGDTMNGVAGTLQSAATLVTGIVFIVWFHRVRTNAEVFAPGADKRKRGWAIGGWFVPIANLWIPYRIAVDTWGSSTPFEADGSYRRVPLTAVNFWWGVFVLSTLVGRYASRVYGHAETADALHSAATTMLFSDALDVVAAVLAVLFVRKLTAMQHAKAAQGPVVAAV
ncbi:DUF4328 domain-containing protein [Streptomyces sp. NPDC093225]|uniref:DUF4328 domain-containing protein n=1 Tax=Streptomyces sp. NPDC093225 TaxID=3366034 RepID=UPI003806EEB3